MAHGCPNADDRQCRQGDEGIVLAASIALQDRLVGPVERGRIHDAQQEEDHAGDQETHGSRNSRRGADR